MQRIQILRHRRLQLGPQVRTCRQAECRLMSLLGYQKLASTTMFTLFWAGDEFAPSLRIPLAHHAQATFAFARRSGANDVGIGTFLQDSMIAAYATLASRLQACSALLGRCL